MTALLPLIARLGCMLAAISHGLKSITSVSPRLAAWTAETTAEVALRRCGAIAAYERNLSAATNALTQDQPEAGSTASWRHAEDLAKTQFEDAQASSDLTPSISGACTRSGATLRTELHEERNPDTPQPWPNFVYRFVHAQREWRTLGERGDASLLLFGILAISLCTGLWLTTNTAIRRIAFDLQQLDQGSGKAQVCATNAPDEPDCIPRAIDHQRGGSASFCILASLRDVDPTSGHEVLCD